MSDHIESSIFYILAGLAAAVILVGGGLLGRRLMKRGSQLTAAQSHLDAANRQLAATFPTVECRGTDESGEPYAFNVSGASLVKMAAGVTVGRQPQSAEIVLNHPEVSREHMRFILSDGVLMVEDADSTNGTFVNGRRLGRGERTALSAGDALMLGKLKLSVRFLDE